MRFNRWVILTSTSMMLALRSVMTMPSCELLKILDANESCVSTIFRRVMLRVMPRIPIKFPSLSRTGDLMVSSQVGLLLSSIWRHSSTMFSVPVATTKLSASMNFSARSWLNSAKSSLPMISLLVFCHAFSTLRLVIE